MLGSVLVGTFPFTGHLSSMNFQFPTGIKPFFDALSFLILKLGVLYMARLCLNILDYTKKPNE